jgi:DNA-binding MarR family transcriptional regulator
VERGLVERRSGEEDRREVLLHLTTAGERVLHRLSLAHRAELRSAAPLLAKTFDVLLGRAERKKAS